MRKEHIRKSSWGSCLWSTTCLHHVAGHQGQQTNDGHLARSKSHVRAPNRWKQVSPRSPTARGSRKCSFYPFGLSSTGRHAKKSEMNGERLSAARTTDCMTREGKRKCLEERSQKNRWEPAQPQFQHSSSSLAKYQKDYYIRIWRTTFGIRVRNTLKLHAFTWKALIRSGDSLALVVWRTRRRQRIKKFAWHW